jgi:signal transduction histidine kinase
MIPEFGSVLFWHVVAFGLSFALALWSVAWTYQRQDQYAAEAFLLFLLATAAWNLTVLLRIVGPVSLAWELHLVEQFFQVSITIVWFYFAVVYAGYRSILTRRRHAYPLAGVAVAMLAVESFPPLAAATNRNPTVVTDPFTFVSWADTALAGIIEVVALAAFAVGSGLILYKLLATNYVQVWQITIVFLATAGTVLVEVLEETLPHTVSGVDYPALAVTGVGVFYVVGLYRYDLFGYTPVDMSDVIDGFTAPVVVLNPERRIVDFNAPAKTMFESLNTGRRGATALPAPIVDAVPVDTAEAIETEVTLTRDGDDRIYRLYATPLDSFGESRGAALTLRDITTQRHRQEELDLLKQILTRALRHNIRNKLDVVRANGQALIDRLDGTERTHARAVLDAADDLAATSTKARVMKDVVANRRRTAPVALCELLTATVAEYEQTYPATTFVVDCPPACSVETTPDVKPAVRNLVENAAEHNPDADAEVRVTLERRATAVVIEIADDGPGIPPNELTVLERGREDALAHGSGIGLWIVTLVAEKIDGELTFDTDADGTTVTLRIAR